MASSTFLAIRHTSRIAQRFVRQGWRPCSLASSVAGVLPEAAAIRSRQDDDASTHVLAPIVEDLVAAVGARQSAAIGRCALSDHGSRDQALDLPKRLPI